MLVDGEDPDLQHGHDEQLDQAGLPQDGAKRDQDRRRAEVCVDYSVVEARRNAGKARGT